MDQVPADTRRASITRSTPSTTARTLPPSRSSSATEYVRGPIVTTNVSPIPPSNFETPLTATATPPLPTATATDREAEKAAEVARGLRYGHFGLGGGRR